MALCFTATLSLSSRDMGEIPGKERGKEKEKEESKVPKVLKSSVKDHSRGASATILDSMGDSIGIFAILQAPRL